MKSYCERDQAPANFDKELVSALVSIFSFLALFFIFCFHTVFNDFWSASYYFHLKNMRKVSNKLYQLSYMMLFFLYFLFTYSIGHLGSLSRVKFCHNQPQLTCFHSQHLTVLWQTKIIFWGLGYMLLSTQSKTLYLLTKDRVRILLEENVPHIFLEI